MCLGHAFIAAHSQAFNVDPDSCALCSLQRHQLLKDFRQLNGGKTDLDLAQFQAALSVRGSDFGEALFNKLDAGEDSDHEDQRPLLLQALDALLTIG